MTTIAVALKWVDLRPEVDRLTGVTHHDERFFGCSTADQAALEVALQLAAHDDAHVVAVSAGPAAADVLLRDTVAAGATRAIRADLAADAPSDQVAAALAAIIGALDDVELVCCGDWSIDRGSGSVPAFLAAELGWGQALGLVSFEGDAGRHGIAESLTVTRRLDHGRREVLRLTGPTVLSFEGSVAELRRAPLTAVLQAKDAPIEVVAAPTHATSPIKVVHRGATRPRARVLPPPDLTLSPRERVLSLTGALVERTPPRTVHCQPEEAAALILDQLRTWGYLDPT